MLSCSWSGESLTCTTALGYMLDKKVTSDLTLLIPNVLEIHEGTYSCQTEGASSSRTCSFILAKGKGFLKSLVGFFLWKNSSPDSQDDVTEYCQTNLKEQRKINICGNNAYLARKLLNPLLNLDTKWWEEIRILTILFLKGTAAVSGYKSGKALSSKLEKVEL